MNTEMFIELVHNVALLLALGLLYDTITLKPRGAKPSFQQLFTGVAIGAIGIAIMLSPWEFTPGIIFDTRSILLGIAGLFFGTVPTLIAVLMTAALRLYQGGGGALTGVAVIVTSGGIGLAWRHLRHNGLEDISMPELYSFGVVVHIAMLLWMLSLPRSVAFEVLSEISLPVMILYPIGTVLLGKMMTGRLARQRAEAEASRLATVVEQATETVVITNLEGDIVYTNPYFGVSAGYAVTEAIGQNPRILKSGRQGAEFYQELWDTITGGETWRGRFINKQKDGGLYHEEATIFPVKNAAGETVNYAAVKRDVTEQVRAEEALQASHRRLEETLAELQQTQKQLVRQERLAAVGQLSGGIAHDFNNILVPIIGYAELGMMKLSSDDKLYTNLQTIKEAAERAARLTRQILAFSRKQVLQIEPLDLNGVILEFEKMFQRLIREDIELQTILNPALKWIEADKTQLEQVLMNLTINARDAMPTGGKLVIETDNVFLDEQYAAKHTGAQPGPYAMLMVSDTGHGIDAETKERIFEPFFTTKETGKGTGLGLATVFGIVKQHRGNIWVYSEPDNGTTFKIYLPQAENLTQPDVPPPTETTSIFGTETILVVEDEEMVRQLVCETLEAHGYNVIEAKSPADGLQLVATNKETIHLLLTDVIMPEMNGVELYQKMAAIQADTRVLYMSGYTDNAIVHHGILQGEVNFLQKPFTIHGLTQKIREVLSKNVVI